jgi:threonine/homoserine/homoserine lactone efflux protein
MHPFLIGVAIGLTIAISFGPGFMVLFQTSIVRGLYAGFMLAFGMLLSDIAFICISFFGLARFISKGDYQIMGIVVGIIIIIIGVVLLLKKGLPLARAEMITSSKSGSEVLILKGFLLNIANPFSLIFWIGVIGIATKNWGLHSPNVILFLSGIVGTAFSTDLLKCYLAGLLRNVFTPSTIRWINKSMGAILIGIGIFVIVKFCF